MNTIAYNNYTYHHALGGTDTCGGIEQNLEELKQLCGFIKDNKIRSYLEIGCANGYLLRFMIKEMRLDCLGITLDKRKPHVGLPIIYGRSQDKSIVESIKDTDLIFVDGDHSYEAVKEDYHNYKSKCKFMAFHDMLGMRDCEGVSRFWNEIKKDYEWIEIIASNRSTASGIGIIKI